MKLLLSEKVLGRIQVMRHNWWEDFIFHEVLIVKPDRVFVSLLSKDTLRIASPSIISDVTKWLSRRRKKKESDFTIFNSDIIRVELTKFLKANNLSIITSKKEYKWRIAQDSTEYCENILQLAFKDKLSIKK